MAEKWNLWSNIPSSMASLILSHMSYKDHFTFRATCKSWSRIRGGFHKLHRPPFMLELYKNKYHLFDPLTNAYQKCMQQLPAAKILYSKVGWLLMSTSVGSDTNIFFFNIFTNERLDLPHFASDEIFDGFCFSSSPLSSDCFVVGVMIPRNKWVNIHLTKPGEKEWTVFDFDILDSLKPFYCECHPIFHKGMVYCLDLTGWLAIFDPENPQESWRICGKPFSRRVNPGDKEIFAVESDGDLLCATISDVGRISIYKLHSPTMEWTKVNNLDGKILYLSRTGSLMETSKFKGMGNKIYSPKFQGRLMMFYSLDTKKYHSYGDEFWRDNVYDLNESIYSTWVKPMH